MLSQQVYIISLTKWMTFFEHKNDGSISVKSFDENSEFLGVHSLKVRLKIFARNMSFKHDEHFQCQSPPSYQQDSRSSTNNTKITKTSIISNQSPDFIWRRKNLFKQTPKSADSPIDNPITTENRLQSPEEIENKLSTWTDEINLNLTFDNIPDKINELCTIMATTASKCSRSKRSKSKRLKKKPWTPELENMAKINRDHFAKWKAAGRPTDKS
ncbi:unnamed protein product [Mytilus edulis]|uniref:Uncharacterized protein n=1 Tax=Mytilus edulis TaxID=6550 RepID=A0A8S3SY85_MYTED|nr:unnamed protein product [Mytilus edulis]